MSGIPTVPGSPVTAVRLGLDRFVLFVADSNGEVLTTSGNAKSDWDLWSSVSERRTMPRSSVTAVGIGGNSVTVFIADPNGSVYTTLGKSVVMGRPYIDSTTIYGPDGNSIAPINGQVPLTIGVRYTVGVHINLGARATYTAGLEVNSLLDVPASLNLLNRVGARLQTRKRVDSHSRQASQVHSRSDFNFAITKLVTCLTATTESAFHVARQIRDCMVVLLRV